MRQTFFKVGRSEEEVEAEIMTIMMTITGRRGQMLIINSDMVKLADDVIGIVEKYQKIKKVIEGQP